MRAIFVLILAVYCIPYQLSAQEDSILAVNVFSQIIDENGTRTKNKKLIYQETYNIRNELHRSVYYDQNSRLSHYSFYFYNAGHLISVESYNKEDEIDSVRQFSYGQNGLKKSEVFYQASGGELKKQGGKIYTVVNDESVPAALLNEKGKKIAKLSYGVENGEISKISTKYKKGARPDGLKTVSETSIFRNKAIDTTTVKYEYFSKEADQFFRVTEYDTLSGKARYISLLDKNGIVLRKEEIRYNNVLKRLSGYGILDSEGKYLKFLSYEYRMHVIDLGVQNRYPLPD